MKPLSIVVAAALLAMVVLIAPARSASSGASDTSAASETDIASFLADFQDQCRASVEAHFAQGGTDPERDAAFFRDLASAWCGCGLNAVSALPRPALQQMARDRTMPEGLSSQLMQCTDTHVRPKIEAMCVIHARNAGIGTERHAPRCACIQRASDTMDIESLQAILDAGPIDFDASFPHCPQTLSP